MGLATCGCSRSSGGSAAKTNRLMLGREAKFGGPHLIAINPLANFNFKPRQELLDLRKEFVHQHPELAAPDYEPSSVFELLEDKKPWWGLSGYDHYGPGARSIEGLSAHSQYFDNPYLLIGLQESFILWDILGAGGESPPHISPASLEWRSDSARATARYEVGDYFAFLSRASPGSDRELALVGYNAVDFGFRYLWVNVEKSTNIEWPSDSRYAFRIPQYIHCGPSCGYPGGCNNMSPAQAKNLRFVVKDLPAKILMSLWRDKPLSNDERPDMIFEIEMH